MIDWSKPVTFEASKSGFIVSVYDYGKNKKKIVTSHFSFFVDDKGKPINKNVGDSFSVFNK